MKAGARESGEVLSCPSAPPDSPRAVAFGVIDHTKSPPEARYLEEVVPVTEELLQLAEPLKPTEVFRFGGDCQTSRCSHWSGEHCNLVERIVDLVPVASLLAPSCRLRPTCRWYAQAGRRACVRCPHVVTLDQNPDPAMREAATGRAR